MDAAGVGAPESPVRQYHACAASRNCFRYGALPRRFHILSYSWSTPARRPSCRRVSARTISRGCGCSSACSRRLPTASLRPATIGRRSPGCSTRLTRFTGLRARTASRRRHVSPRGSRRPRRTGWPDPTIPRWTGDRSSTGSWPASPRCSASRFHAPQRQRPLPLPLPLRHPRRHPRCRCLGWARPLVRRGLRVQPRRLPHQPDPSRPPRPRPRPPPPALRPAGCRQSDGLRGPVRVRAPRTRRLRSPRRAHAPRRPPGPPRRRRRRRRGRSSQRRRPPRPLAPRLGARVARPTTHSRRPLRRRLASRLRRSSPRPPSRLGRPTQHSCRGSSRPNRRSKSQVVQSCRSQRPQRRRLRRLRPFQSP